LLKKREKYNKIEMQEIETSKNLDRLAYEFYNDPKKYYVIMRANNIMFYFDKLENNIILIPETEPKE